MWNNGIDGPINIEGDSRYHLNMPTQVYNNELDDHRVEPVHMTRIYAGDDPSNPFMTVALRFTDEAEAKLVLANYWAEPTVE